MKITDEMIEALRVLKEGAAGNFRVSPEVRNAINVLDNADFFAPIDDARNEREDGS